MFDVASMLTQLITFFAIAGGGGSSGGGGGGGGGGSFSGGGGSYSSGGGGSGSDGDWWVFIVFIIIFGLATFIAYRGGKEAAKQLKARRDRMNAALAQAAAKDVIWEPHTLETHAKDTFLKYQKDWSAFDLDSMKKYMTPHYYQHNLLMMGAMKLLDRQNDVQKPTVLSAEIYAFTDSEDNTKDVHTVQLNYFVHDVLNDTKENKPLFSQNLSGTEYYKFVRVGKDWKFAGIDQATADPTRRNRGLEQFADQNGFFFSLDWGHLLLPRRGQLFSQGTFGTSDINNHVIGYYKDVIVQIYNYTAIPGMSSWEYLIAQTSVPKRYGNIVVRRKGSGAGMTTKGLRKLKTEWEDFNKKYEVLASDAELATSFELLHPAFMDQLEALPFEVNIEVVDNIVYLYSRGTGLKNSENYETMLGILKAAFKEMRM